MICSPSTGYMALGLRPRAILPASGEQIVMSPSLKGNNCIICHYENLPIQRFSSAVKIDEFHMTIFDNFKFFAQNIDRGYTLEPPRCGNSNEYPQAMFRNKNKKNCIPLYTPVLLNKIGV